jgi:hypothetical protein
MISLKWTNFEEKKTAVVTQDDKYFEVFKIRD